MIIETFGGITIMANIIVGIFLIIKGARLMVKTSYYHLIKDTLEEISIEIVSVERRNSRRFGIYYNCIYKYNWKNKEKYYKTSRTTFKEIGDIDVYFIDPRFDIIYDYELEEDGKSFFGMILMITGIGLVLTQIL